MINRKKTFALLTVPTDEKTLEILTFNDAEIILDNKYSGKDFLEDASNYLLDLKNSKNLEGVILDFYCHEDPEFILQIRKHFSDFCESKGILFRLVYQNVIFTSMLLFHSDMNFNPEDTVYAIWIKNDMLFSYKIEGNTLYFINEMKIEDDFSSNEKYDRLLDCHYPPKFLILGSLSSDPRLKQLKNRFKATKTKVMHCTYEDCLKKSASHYLSRFIRAKDWRWNFKLSNSTNPKMQKQREKPRQNKTIILMAMFAFIVLAIAVAVIFSSTEMLNVDEMDEQTVIYPDECETEIIVKKETYVVDSKVFEHLKDMMTNGVKIDETIIPNVETRKQLEKLQSTYLEFHANLKKIEDSLKFLEQRIGRNFIYDDECG